MELPLNRLVFDPPDTVPSLVEGVDIYSIVVEVAELEMDDVDMVICCGHTFCDAAHIAGERCASLGL